MPIPSPADFRNKTKKHSEVREMLAQMAGSVAEKEYVDSNKSFNLSIALTDGENFITEAQAKNNVLYFTGALTAEATVIFPKYRANYFIQNSTNKKLFVKTLDQSETVRFVDVDDRQLFINTSASMRQLYGNKIDQGGHAKDVTADTLAWTDTSQKLANAAFVHNVSKGRAGHFNVDLSSAQNGFIIPADALNYSTISFVGALAADIKIVMPSANATWTFLNNTTGSKVITVTNGVDTSPIEIHPGQTATINQASAFLRYIGLPSRNGYLRGSYEADSPPTSDNSNRVATAAHVNAKIDQKQGIKTITLSDDNLVVAVADMDRAIISLSGTLTNVSDVVLGSSAKFHLIVNNTNKVLNIKGPQQPTAFELRVGVRTLVMCSGGYVHQVSAKALANEYLITPSADSPATLDKTNRLATTAHVKAWTEYLDSIRSVTLTEGQTALSVDVLDRGNIVFLGELSAAVVLKIDASFVGKRYFRNGTNVKINVLGSGQNGVGLELPPGAVAFVLINGTYISIISNSASSGSGGITEIPIGSATKVGGFKVGSGLTVSQSGVLSATPQSALSLQNVGKFKEGESYNQGQIVEHGSGIYEVKSNTTNALTPFNNPSFNKISHNNYAGPLRNLSVISTVKTDISQASLVPYFMTKDGMATICKEARYLKVSFDYGRTWEPGNILDAGSRSGVRWVKQTNDGELLVCTYTTSDTEATINKVLKSSGWKTGMTTSPVWTEVWRIQKKGISPSDWGFSQHNNFVIMTEYGYKNGVDPVENAETYARYVYLSKDFGATWQTIFDLGDFTDGVGVHMHGSCFDPYWGRIWTSHGDGAFGSNGLFYSDDLGKTWNSATEFHNEGSNFPQSVHIVALPTCILLCSDSYPNGIQRIDRAQGKIPHKGYYTIEPAYMNPDQLERLNHLFHHTAKAEWMPDSPWSFVWGCETNPGKSGCVATFDGWNFHEVWVSDSNSSVGYGGRTVLGVTPENEVIIGCNDPANGSNTWYEIRTKVSID